MKRRRFTTTSVSIGLAGMSGCLSTFDSSSSPENAVSLWIKNWFDSGTRTVMIRAEGINSDENYEDEFEVPVDEDVREDGILPSGDYEVTASVRNGPEKTENWSMSGCSENDILVRVSESGIVIRPSCHHG